jgi:hypothetical protein
VGKVARKCPTIERNTMNANQGLKTVYIKNKGLTSSAFEFLPDY